MLGTGVIESRTEISASRGDQKKAKKAGELHPAKGRKPSDQNNQQQNAMNGQLRKAAANLDPNRRRESYVARATQKLSVKVR
jgi:hypothetical protein